MLWKALFLPFAILGEGRGNKSLNLAWELIQGFVHIWNHTNQGVCVQIPKSSGEGIDFSIINLNLSKLLENKLNTVVKNCIANCTWGRAWRVNQDAFYQISSANWTDLWNKTCYRWNMSEPVTPILGAPFILPLPPCLEDLMDIYNTSGYHVPKSLIGLHPLKQNLLSIPVWLNGLLCGAYKFPISQAKNMVKLTEPDNEWAWSIKHIWYRDTDPGRPVDEKNVEIPSPEYSQLMNCTTILNCTTGVGNPIETWYIPELRTFMRDMCTCWGYPSQGFRNLDNRCNGTWRTRTTVIRCSIPTSHGPEHRKGTWVLRNDYYQCNTASYPAPQGTLWGCLNGKIYSQINVRKHAGLQCGIEIPTMCPSRVFDFSMPHQIRRRRESDGPKVRTKWVVHGIRVPDYYTWGMTTSLMLENIFTPYVTLERHQLVLENLTWQVHVLSNWTNYAFGEMNVHIQQVSKMTLQNRLALDMLLLKEQGVCGMLNLTDGECCLTIHNAITTLEEARKKMKEVSEQTGELFQAIQPKD
ncbi:hypothetical protein QYF61_019763, partial [Mycteria americana]